MEQRHDRSIGAWPRAHKRLAHVPSPTLCGVFQDTAITGDEPTVAGGPMSDAKESIAFLENSAQRTQEVHS